MNISIALSRLPDGRIEVRPLVKLNGLWGAFQGTLKANGGRNQKLPSGSWQSSVPAERCAALAEQLEAAGLAVSASPDVKALLERAVSAREELSAELDGETAAAEEHAGMRLYPFQREGVEWLRTHDRALLGDEMGLGKTVQALLAHPQARPLLIICPAALKGNWAAEADRWRPDLETTILEGRGSFRWPRAGEVMIVNYDLLPSEEELVDESKTGHMANATTVVCDEAHAIKSWKAKRTKRFRAIAKMASEAGGRVWLLTGTPLLNRPDELWTVLGGAALDRDAFGGWSTFTSCFSAYRDRFKAWHWGSPDSTVAERLRAVMLRRRRAEVLPDLPTKTFRTIETSPLGKGAIRELDAIYLEIEEAGLWEDPKCLPTFEGFSKARELLAKSKIETLLELVADYEAQDEPVIVFSAHRAPVDALASREGWGAITGDTPPAERTAIVEKFQAGELRGIAGTIGAMGVGLTLTRAAHEIFVDRAWTPALNEQAEDRAVRIGQTRGVLITILCAPHALDRHVTALLGEKTKTIDSTVNAASGQREVSLAEIAARKATKKVGKRAEQGGSDRRLASTETERWVASAIRQLCQDDYDHAREQNGMGFSKFDGPFGHALDVQLGRGLTERQWAAAEKLCRKYRRQIGEAPEVEGT